MYEKLLEIKEKLDDVVPSFMRYALTVDYHGIQYRHAWGKWWWTYALSPLDESITQLHMSIASNIRAWRFDSFSNEEKILWDWFSGSIPDGFEVMPIDFVLGGSYAKFPYTKDLFSEVKTVKVPLEHYYLRNASGRAGVSIEHKRIVWSLDKY